MGPPSRAAFVRPEVALVFLWGGTGEMAAFLKIVSGVYLAFIWLAFALTAAGMHTVKAPIASVREAQVAVDAFYAVVKDRCPVASSSERRRRGSRSGQVSEVIKKAFRLRQNGFNILSENLKKIYDLRDKAVHPKGGIGDTIEHPELNVGVEWR